MLSPLGPSALTRYANGIAVGGPPEWDGLAYNLCTTFYSELPLGAACGPENYPEDGSVIN